MVPTLIVLGFIVGLFGRRAWWFVAVAAIGWPIVIAISGVDTTYNTSLLVLGAAALGAVNAAVGVATGHAIHRAVGRVSAWR